MLNQSRNLTLTRCAFFPPSEFSIIKDSFIKKLNVKDKSILEGRGGGLTNQSRNADLLNSTNSSLTNSPDKKDDSNISSMSVGQKF